jgi:outer membrane protein assembly factor BamB
LYALRTEDGHLLWKYQTGNIIRGAPAIWEQLLFVGSDDGNLYGLNRETGALVWHYRLGGAIVAGPTVAGNRLLVGATDRRLHAFDLELVQEARDDLP